MLNLIFKQLIFSRRFIIFSIFFAAFYLMFFAKTMEYKLIFDSSSFIRYFVTTIFLIPSLSIVLFDDNNFYFICNQYKIRRLNIKYILLLYIFTALLVSLLFALPFIVFDFIILNTMTILEPIFELAKFSSIIVFYIVLAIPNNAKNRTSFFYFTLMTYNFIFIINFPIIIDDIFNYITGSSIVFFARFSPFWLLNEKVDKKFLYGEIFGYNNSSVLGIPASIFTMLLFFIVSFLIYRFVIVNQFNKYVEEIKNI